MDAQQNLPLAPRDLLILAVLAEGPSHGYGLIKSVEARSQSGVLLDPANLYRVLRRMVRLGWIRQSSVGDDSRRRTYEIESYGLLVLRAEVERLERLLEHARPAVAGP